MSPLKKSLVWAGVLGAIIAVVALVIAWGAQLPEGPVAIAWDREPCAECRMHVGEPGFAAQLQTTDGRILNFDDPGCALRFVARERPSVRALYFHHHQEDLWLEQSQTAFKRGAPTPMGYNLSAVRLNAPEALSLEQASRLVADAPPTATR